MVCRSLNLSSSVGALVVAKGTTVKDVRASEQMVIRSRRKTRQSIRKRLIVWQSNLLSCPPRRRLVGRGGKNWCYSLSFFHPVSNDSSLRHFFALLVSFINHQDKVNERKEMRTAHYEILHLPNTHPPTPTPCTSPPKPRGNVTGADTKDYLWQRPASGG